MPSPPHPRLRNRHSLPCAVSNGAHPSDYAARELWTKIPCDSLEYRRVVPTSESPTTRPELNVPLSKHRNRRSAPTSRLQRYLAPSQPDTRIRSHLLAGSKT